MKSTAGPDCRTSSNFRLQLIGNLTHDKVQFGRIWLDIETNTSPGCEWSTTSESACIGRLTGMDVVRVCRTAVYSPAPKMLTVADQRAAPCARVVHVLSQTRRRTANSWAKSSPQQRRPMSPSASTPQCTCGPPTWQVRDGAIIAAVDGCPVAVVCACGGCMGLCGAVGPPDIADGCPILVLRRRDHDVDHRISKSLQTRPPPTTAPWHPRGRCGTLTTRSVILQQG